MKKITFIAVAFLAFSSCSDSASGEATQEVTEEPKEVNFNADVENSMIQWTDGEGEHTGFLKISEGTVKVKGTTLVSGNLTVDMNSVSLAEDGPGAEKLTKHLKNEDFFNVETFGTSSVKFGGLKDGKLSTTINFLGVELTQDVAVEVKIEEGAVSISGEFPFDFKDSKMPYIMPDDQGEVGAPSTVDFKIDLRFKK